jgi:hypothetical protein
VSSQDDVHRIATALPCVNEHVLAPTGAKLSKSLLREQGKGVLPADVEPWMLDTTAWPGDVDNYESVASVNPLASREDQLANIRQIYPPEREALGVVAIGIQLVGPPRPA